jgi:cation:H+ antiporter
MLAGAYLVVSSATEIATWLGVSPVIIGILVVGLGTTIPELLFSVKSAKQNDDSMAVGDILGTVLADATIVIGLLALISPFGFSRITIYVGGIFMVSAAFILFSFMRSGRMVTKREGFALVVLWLTFFLVELVIATTQVA